MFFQSLVPLLKTRTLKLIVTTDGIGDNPVLSVTVLPVVEDKDAERGLATPLGVTGTASELDAGFAAAVAEFSTAHIGLTTTLTDAKATMDEAAAAEKKKADDRAVKAKSTVKAPATSKPQPIAAKKSVVAAPPVATATPGLFDAGDGPIAEPAGVGADAVEEGT